MNICINYWLVRNEDAVKWKITNLRMEEAVLNGKLQMNSAKYREYLCNCCLNKEL